MANAIKRDGNIGNAYLNLVKQFPLTSIRDDEHLGQAQEMLDSLFVREPLDDGEEDYLEALSDLIEIYESQNVHFDDPSDADMLTYLMELRGVNQSTLATETKIQKSTISEVIAGKRTLTRPQIAKLAKYFGVGQGTFSMAVLA